MVDSRLAFDIIAKDDASRVFDKVARSSDKTAAALAKTGKVSDSVAKSSANLTKARNAESNALDRVQIAEQKLSEVRDNSNSKASQVLIAEKALAKARRDAAVAGNVAQKAAHDLGNALDDEGKKAGKGFGKGVLHWFTGAGKDLEKAGRAGGESVNAGFVGVLKTPVVGPAVVAGILAAAATVLPAAGAVAAGAVVSGFGAGLAGLGIAFAAKSVAVKNTWNRTLWSMAADMKVLSKPFESTLISMAGVAKRTFATFKPELSTAFKSLAPSLTEFGDLLGRAFEKLAPAIQPLSMAFQDVLKSLGPAMQSAVGNVAKGLQDLAESVQKSPNALADLVKGMGDLTKMLLDGIAVLNNINGAFERLTGGVSLVDGVMEGLKVAVNTTLGPFILLEKAMNAVGIKTNQLDQSVAISADTTKLWTQGLTAAQVAAVGTGAALDPLPAKVESVATKFQRQWAATQKANEALTRMSGLLLTLSGAQIAYQQAVDDATAAVKENGRTHDISTAKGRANKTALDQVAASANAQMLAMRNASDGNLAAYKASAVARQGFVKLAVQMGYSKTQAQAMAQSLIAIPNVTREARLKANKADLDAKLAAAKKQLADKDLTKERRAQLNADIKRLVAQVNAAQAKINSLQGKTVSIVTKYSSTGVNLTAPSSVGRRAAGGPVKQGQPYIVGEHRPELFVPKQDGTILPRVPAMGQGVAAGMAAGIQGGTSSAVSAAAGLAYAVIDKTKQVLGISSPSKVFTRLALYIGQGFTRGIHGSVASIQSAMSSLMSKVVNLGFKRAKQNRILLMLQMENKALQAMAIRRGQVATQLKAAQARLAGAVQLREDFRKNITDAALSFNAITNLQPDAGGKLSAQAIIERMQATVTKTWQFATNLARLKKLGLRSDLYKQIAEAGVEAGGATAEGLLQGGKGAINTVNKLQANIASASATLGNTAANNLYQAGVDAAQGLVNGLLAKTKALDLASKKLADAIVARIKKQLGIRSPSRVLEWHGSMAGKGFARGVEGEYGAVARAGSGLGAAVTPNSGRPRRAAPVRVPSQQRVVLEFRGDGSRYMEFLIGEFRKYVRVNGGDVQAVLGR